MTTFLTDLGLSTLNLFVEIAKYLILGLSVAGIMSVLISKAFVARHIGKDNFASVLKASLLGVPLPLCSCGVVPTAAYLRRSGASRPALMGFLISTPQTGMDSIFATYGMLGPLFAIFRPLAALLTGLLGGAISMLAGGKESEEGKLREESTEDQETRGLPEKVRAAVTYAFGEAVDDIAVHFLVGLFIAGLITVLIPDDFFAGRMIGSGLPAMLLMVAIGIPMYVCSTSSIPIAVALIAKGISPGAAYVFLVAGPATNAASLAILTKVLGKRQTILYVLSIIIGSLMFGPLMDFIIRITGGMPPVMSAHMHSAGFTWFDYTLAGFLTLLILISLARRFIHMNKTRTDRDASHRNADDSREFSIDGMSCHHCAANVESALKEIPGIKTVQVDLEAKRAVLTGDAEDALIHQAIHNAGYTVVEHPSSGK